VKQSHVVHLAPLTTRILPHTSHLYTHCHTAPRVAVVLLLRVRFMNDVTIAGLVASCFILSVYGCRPANQDALPLMLSWCSPGQRSNVSSLLSIAAAQPWGPDAQLPICWKRIFNLLHTLSTYSFGVRTFICKRCSSVNFFFYFFWQIMSPGPFILRINLKLRILQTACRSF
jgi:hypothetical protein